MKLTPLDIKKQEFKRIMRGYDPVEVDAFLDMVADEFENLLREKNRVADEIIALRTQLHDYQQVEKTLKDTLVTAQENITASRQSTKREADIILREAELKAEKIVENARTRLERMKSDIMIIKAQKESFARRLRHLLESQIELISVLELDDTGYEERALPSRSGENSKAGASNSRAGRKKVDIPAAPHPEEPDAAGEERAAGDDGSTPGSDEDGTGRMPRISDQFIT